MTTILSKLIGNDEAARLLHITPATLRFWRCKGKGPRYIKFGPAKQAGVAYYVDDIDAWIAARKFDSTTAHSEAMRAAGLDAGRYRTIPHLPITPPWLIPQAEQSVV